jgi:two-component system, OmpR family, sensor histidine kinase KdpD
MNKPFDSRAPGGSNMEEHRPDPDEILAGIRKEEERKHQGKLKIFFGAAPGVGKTYAMLAAARQKLTEGVDVVAGLVETHNREETKALLSGMEILARRSIEYKGAVLEEFDLDKALERKPVVILMDELAHTNAPGSRHNKRWQDVFELLGAGMDVYTTLNVQHIESLNDVVAQITGITVRETLPDSVLERADEIELIDLPPDDLLVRLKEGKVYVPDLASLAQKNFFRKGNLLALRELSLRRTAESVDTQMQDYRRTEGVRAVWPAAERILVCVGPSPFAVRLIRSAKRMADSLHAEWIAVNVEAPSKVRPSENDLRKLADNMRLAESLGAETAVLSGHKASEEILSYARARNVTRIIIGKPAHPRWKDMLFGSMLDNIVRGSGDIEVYAISGDVEIAPAAGQSKKADKKTSPKEWLITVLGVAAATGISFVMDYYLAIVDVVMTYILFVVLIASWTNKRPALLASLLSVAAFDFFFVPPYYTFAVTDIKYVVTFAVMFAVAFITSNLTLRIRAQADAARRRERRTAALYRFSAELVRERDITRIGCIAVRHISEIFSGKTAILVPDENGSLSVLAGTPENPAPDERELSVARWSFDHKQHAGRGTDTLPGARGLYIPLIAASRTVGVVSVILNDTVLFDREQTHALENFVHQAAMSIERAILADEAQMAMIKAETEELRNTLLSSLSHDLRTPLAAITGASTTLLQQEAELDTVNKRELVRTIIEESEHLNRIIRNVLDMTRIESGAIKVKKEWMHVEEIVGAVLNRLSDRLAAHPVTINIPADLPLVSFDPLLIEQTLTNLLENAIKYTPPAAAFDIAASIGSDGILVEVSDNGPGVKAGDEERIFDKFVRSNSAAGGIGLGLTICRAIITAHGGRIWMEHRPGGGAIFRFTLPVLEKPPEVEAEVE